MTTDNLQRGVLVLGKSRLVLDETLARLNDLGYRAQGTNDFSSDIPDLFDAEEIDVVVLGGAVPPARKAELREQIAAINPQTIFVDSLIGIPGVVVNQVQGAFNLERRRFTRAPTYIPEDRAIRLTLTEDEDVEVAVWWRTSFVPPNLTSDSLLLVDDRLAAGDHIVPIPVRVPRQSAFAAVQAGAAYYAFSITTEE